MQTVHSARADSQIQLPDDVIYSRGHETPKSAKWGLLKILTYQPILTIDITFYLGTQSLSEPLSATQ